MSGQRSGRRRAGGSVSGWRIISQAMLTAENRMNATKIARQPKAAMIPAPTVGASAGTSAKTSMMNDSVRAMSRPEVRSRTIAMATTRGPDAPSPWIRRAARISSRLGAIHAAAAAAM